MNNLSDEEKNACFRRIRWVRGAKHELAWKLLLGVAEIHLSRSFKPSEILGPIDASSKPGASSVVGARRPCPYIENTLQKRMEMMHVRR